MQAHRWEHTFQSTHRRAHIGEHTEESTHMRVHIWEHTYETKEEEIRSEDPEAHFVRACAIELHMGIRDILYRNLHEKCRAPIPGHRFCASLCSRNPHGDFTRVLRRAMLHGNLQEKCRTPVPRRTFCMEIYKTKRTWDVTFKKTILCGNLKEKCRSLLPGGAFCMEKTHRDISQEPFCLEIYLKKCRTLCPNCECKNPSVRPHCLGNNFRGRNPWDNLPRLTLQKHRRGRWLVDLRWEPGKSSKFSLVLQLVGLWLLYKRCSLSSGDYMWFFIYGLKGMIIG